MADIEAGIMDRSGDSMTKAAYWISIINIIFAVGGILIYLAIVAAAGAGGAFSR